MSDWIEKDGKKYYEESYMILANNNAQRRGERIKELTAELERAKATMQLAHDELMNLQPHIPRSCYPGREGFIDAHVGKAMKLLSPAGNERCNHVWLDGLPSEYCVECGDRRFSRYETDGDKQ